MSIQLKVSNSLKSLLLELTNEVQETTSVFRPFYLVTQTEGMNNWLKLQLAEQLGISANIQFLKPNDIIHLAYRLLGGKYSQSISAHDLNWLLFKALGEKEFIQKYPYIADYYSKSSLDADSKQMALAEKVADLFDQYQVYRTDMIQEWNDNKGEDHWQKTLWLRTKELAGDSFPDKTMVGNYILEALKNPENVENLKQNLPTIYFFGLSLITDYHLSLIHALSQHISIHFLIQNPAPADYWYEDKSERVIDFLKRKNIYPKEEESMANPLLVGWGKLIQDTFMMLFKDEEALNNYQDIQSFEPGTDTLLHKIQNSIFHNEKENLHFSNELISDASLTINSCFGPVREVEVLYNYLVHLVDQKKEELSARDIVVMVSDIDLYASYIRAIFDNAPYKFRYTIADESYAVSDSISNTLMAVLSMTESQFTSEKVVSLLDFSALRKQFQLSDTTQIRQWVDAVNIRFGMKGSRADDSDYLSWEYGLKRIMYGLCMSGSEEFGEGETSFYPLDAIEGFDMFQATHFAYFVETLMDSMKRRRKKRSIAEWVNYMEDTIRIFIGEREDNEDEDYILLLNQLERYNLLQEIFTEEVSYDVFLNNFLPTLSNATRSHAFAGGGITFCSLIPMRSIPFKVVALLGMNFDKFPRKDNRLSFDLMNREKRLGDRNVKENDKHLFLETLLSAEDYLYISYVGQSVKDNSPFPPSALVDELVDFIQTNSENPHEVHENFIQKHPLHGFSKKYNAGNPNLYSYLLSHQKSEIDLFTKESEIEFDFQEIHTEKFTSFFKNPIKGFYNRVLNVYYQEDELSLKETEIFDLDNLEKWYFRNQLLHLNEEEMEGFREKEVKLGNLPLKNKSKVDLEAILEDIEFVRNSYVKLTDGLEEESVEIALEIDDSILSGKVNGIFNGNLIRYSFSKYDLKYKFEAYLDYLLLTASGREIEVLYISKEKGKIYTGNNQISKEEALFQLKELVKLYKIGHQRILPFDFDFNVEAKELDGLNQDKFNVKLENYFNGFNFKSSDMHHIKEYQSENGVFHSKDAFQNYQEIAELTIRPISEFFKD